MAQDESTYGFSKQDASLIIQGIESRSGGFPEWQPVPRGSVVCQTPGGGIAARSGTTVSSASCTVQTRSGSTLSAGSGTLTVYNLSTTAVGGTAYIVACPTNIGYVAVWEDC